MWHCPLLSLVDTTSPSCLSHLCPLLAASPHLSGRGGDLRFLCVAMPGLSVSCAARLWPLQPGWVWPSYRGRSGTFWVRSEPYFASARPGHIAGAGLLLTHFSGQSDRRQPLISMRETPTRGVGGWPSPSMVLILRPDSPWQELWDSWVWCEYGD